MRTHLVERLLGSRAIPSRMLGGRPVVLSVGLTRMHASGPLWSRPWKLMSAPAVVVSLAVEGFLLPNVRWLAVGMIVCWCKANVCTVAAVTFS